MITLTNENDVFQGIGGNQHILSLDGDDRIIGGPGDDIVEGGNDNDWVRGGKGSDWLFGDDGNDWLSGGNGNDALYGGTGNDALSGGKGDDALIGGAGADILTSVQGDDILVGGNGMAWIDTYGTFTVTGVTGDGERDEFRITGRSGSGFDTILGFEDGTDVLRFKQIDVANAFQIGDDVLINTTGGGFVNVVGTTIADLAGSVKGTDHFNTAMPSDDGEGVIINLARQGYYYKADAPKVLLAGDSLTDGSYSVSSDGSRLTESVGFRGYLHDKLVDLGIWVDFVGSRNVTDGNPAISTSIPDPDHFGNGGATIDDILDGTVSLQSELEKYTPDITLFAAGINDIRGTLANDDINVGFTPVMSEDRKVLETSLNRVIEKFLDVAGSDQYLVMSTIAPATSNYTRGAAINPDNIVQYNTVFKGLETDDRIRIFDSPFHDQDGKPTTNHLSLQGTGSDVEAAANDGKDLLHWTESGNRTYAEKMAEFLTGERGAFGGILSITTDWKPYVGDNAYGGSGNDYLVGNTGDNVIHGGAGDDVIRGGSGNDLMNGGDGADYFQFAISEEDPGKVYTNTIEDFSVGTDWIQELEVLWFTEVNERDVDGDGDPDTELISHDYGTIVHLLDVSGVDYGDIVLPS